MNLFIWISIHSLASIACDINYSYAEWTPRENDTLIVDVIPFVPDVSVEGFKNLNPGVNPDMLYYHITSPYRLPYRPNMTVLPPAVLSGDCPKTLLLDSVEISRQAPSSTPTGSGAHVPEITSMATADGETMGTTSIYSVIESTESNPTSDITYTIVSPRTGSTTNVEATASPTTTSTTSKLTATTLHMTTGSAHKETASQTARPKSSQEKGTPLCYGDSGSASSEEPWMAYRQSFCDELKKVPLTRAGLTRQSKTKDITFGVSFSRSGQGCYEYKVNDRTCQAYLQKIEDQCPKYGGYIWSDCFLIWAYVHVAD
ncbi:hypothetical protein FOFC_03159 [Fusarium oxysporum]|nr:hypothetical protein FOFC_03159 [Fusarium oxysporum]